MNKIENLIITSVEDAMEVIQYLKSANEELKKQVESYKGRFETCETALNFNRKERDQLKAEIGRNVDLLRSCLHRLKHPTNSNKFQIGDHVLIERVEKAFYPTTNPEDEKK